VYIAPTHPNNVVPTACSFAGGSGTCATARSLWLDRHLALRSFNHGDRDPWPFQQMNKWESRRSQFGVQSSIWDSPQIYIFTRFEPLR